jgi:phosphomannomutase
VQIAFGSDGFRGEIAHTLTKESVARIVSGATAFLQSALPQPKGALVLVGYDTRFLAREFAQLAVRILASAGYTPLLARQACPSPYLSFAVKHLGAALGIQLTASHNPPLYGGIKLKGAIGGSLPPAEVAEVERLANAVSPESVRSLPLITKCPPPKTFDVDGEYTRALSKACGWGGDPQLRLALDCMHGVAAGIYRTVLDGMFDLTCILRGNPDPLFGGVKPEPLSERLLELERRLSFEGNSSLGLAFDGDGDRLAVVDERGGYLATHEIFCLLLEYMVKQHGKQGMVVASVSFSGLVQRVAEAHGCVVYEVPVGFKSVTAAMLETGAFMGGEESGGTGFAHFLPERDALLMALMLLHARQLAGTSLHEMVQQLYATYGRPHFLHLDLPLPAGTDARELKLRLRDLAALTELAGDTVQSLNHRDGMKLRTADGWVLVRASGTEPLLRVYAEGRDQAQARDYAGAVLDFLGIKA